MDLNFLIDTNVAIQIEEAGQEGQIRELFAKLHAAIVHYRIPTFYHPLSESDLKNDKDESRRKEMLSRLKKYPRLESPPNADGSDLEVLFGGISSPNDLIDCQILFALYRNCVAYLITEDIQIHKRARNADIGERVLSTAEAIDLIRRSYERASVQLPSVQEEFTYNIDIKDPLFDSLRADYEGFDKWYKEKCCAKQRKAWTVRTDGRLAGICIYKHDEQEEFKGIDMPSIKLCTFKVSDDFRGAKFGELLIKNAFRYAIENRIKTIWVTTHEKQAVLIQFLKDFGFQVHKELAGKDMVFYKQMQPPSNVPVTKPLDFHIRYSPHYLDDEDISKFVIPIRPVFYDLLFPENAPQLGFGTGVPGNTIKKVYLSRSKIRELPVGSLIFFYRSAPQQNLTTIGIAEKARRLNNIEAIATAIGKRSVYTHDNVEEMLKDSSDILVINFRLVTHLAEPIGVARLVKEKIFNQRPPQSIMLLDESRYLNLKNLLTPAFRHPNVHVMKLAKIPFDATAAGKKTIEIRLLDEKRKLIAVGDSIKFVHADNVERTITAKVIGLRPYQRLIELTSEEDFSKTGSIYKSRREWYKQLSEYYSIEDRRKYHALCIEIEVLKGS